MRRPTVHIILVALASLAVGVSGAQAHGPSHGDLLLSAPSRGMNYKGLVDTETASKCKGALKTEVGGICTHGPDPAPPGVDITKKISTADLRSAAAHARYVAGGPATVEGASEGSQITALDGPAGQVICQGTGTDGKRTQVLYVVASNQTNRFASLLTTLSAYVLSMDGQFNDSAAKTGGVRHIRFVTKANGSGCELDIRPVVIDPAAITNFGSSVTAVQAQGFNLPDRKYLMFVDSNNYCGIGGLYVDDQPGQQNANNSSSSLYSRSDTGCWGFAEAHELMHNLGAVQRSAPKATTGMHCVDRYDVMCYDDGSGMPMEYVCPQSDQRLFDCNNQDYFNTSPAVGSYLDTHWNTARSAYLIAAAAPPPPDTTPPVVPTGLSGAVSSTGSAQINWTLGSEPDLAGYDILRDAVKVASVGKVSTFTEPALLSGQTYLYTVRSRDESGNLSAQTAAIPLTQPSKATMTGTFKLKTGALLSRPLVPGLTVAQGSGVNKNGTPATIKITLQSGGVTLATVTGTNVTLPYFAGSGGTHNWTISGAKGVTYSINLSYIAE